MIDQRDRTRHLPALATAVGLLLAAAAGLAVAGLLGLWVADHVASTRLWRVEAVIAPLVVAAGVLAAGWVGCSALVAAACALARSAGGAWRGGEAAVQRWAPGVVRRALALTVAAGIGLGSAAGAHAAAEAPPAPVTVTTDLGWTPTATATAALPSAASASEQPGSDATPSPVALPGIDSASAAAAALPDADTTHVDVSSPVAAAPAPPPLAVAPAATGLTEPVAAHAPRVADTVTPSPVRPAGTIEVRHGDTLWALAARTLGPDASDAEIADEWPRWYAANASTIGPDPDVLQPGQLLVVPSTTAGGAR